MPRSRRCSQPRVNNYHNNNDKINNNNNDSWNDFRIGAIIVTHNKSNESDSAVRVEYFAFSTTTVVVASDRSAIRTTWPPSRSTGADPSHRFSSSTTTTATTTATTTTTAATDVDPLRHHSFLHPYQYPLTDFHLRTVAVLISLAASLSELFLIVRHGGGVKPKFELAAEYCRAKTNMSGPARTEQPFSNLVGSGE